MRHFTVKKLILIFFCLFIGTDRLHAQTITDIDGNVYPTVQIGTQVWMAENLKTTRFRDGTNIPQIPDSVQWSGGTFPGFCWYANAVAYKDIFGALYNWEAVSSGKLAPEGWHVATDKDWSILVDYLGGGPYAGGKLKALGSIDVGDGYWYTPNAGATNETGFSAQGGGAREFNGAFNYIFSHGYFWTSTAGNTGMAICRRLFYNSTEVDSGSINRTAGLSVRCVRDSVVGGPETVPKGNVKVYSIPGTGRIVVTGIEECSFSLSVYDLAGRLVAKSVLRPGIYLVWVAGCGWEVWRKVMVGE
jgi:uncharacterized protein (TIGR02145 family)